MISQEEKKYQKISKIIVTRNGSCMVLDIAHVNSNEKMYPKKVK